MPPIAESTLFGSSPGPWDYNGNMKVTVQAVDPHGLGSNELESAELYIFRDADALEAIAGNTNASAAKFRAIIDPDDDGVCNYDYNNDGSYDVFPTDPNEWADSDGDGVGDNEDAFPNDPTESADKDGDGIGANTDPNDTDANDPVIPAVFTFSADGMTVDGKTVSDNNWTNNRPVGYFAGQFGDTVTYDPTGGNLVFTGDTTGMMVEYVFVETSNVSAYHNTNYQSFHTSSGLISPTTQWSFTLPEPKDEGYQHQFYVYFENAYGQGSYPTSIHTDTNGTPFRINGGTNYDTGGWQGVSSIFVASTQEAEDYVRGDIAASGTINYTAAQGGPQPWSTASGQDGWTIVDVSGNVRNSSVDFNSTNTYWNFGHTHLAKSWEDSGNNGLYINDTLVAVKGDTVGLSPAGKEMNKYQYVSDGTYASSIETMYSVSDNGMSSITPWGQDIMSNSTLPGYWVVGDTPSANWGNFNVSTPTAYVRFGVRTFDGINPAHPAIAADSSWQPGITGGGAPVLFVLETEQQYQNAVANHQASGSIYGFLDIGHNDPSGEP